MTKLLPILLIPLAVAVVLTLFAWPNARLEPRDMLPGPAGWLGQLLPPGAGGNLLRSTGLFDGAGGGGHAGVLAVWATAGLAALLAADLRRRRAVTAPVTATAVA